MKQNNSNKAIRELLPYLWPNNIGMRTRVVLSMLCLLLSKVASIMIPITYKYAVDLLDGIVSEGKANLYLLSYVLLTYGAARISSTMFAELRDGIFAKVGQRATRTIALRVFKHMHDLSLRFHITRKTGGVSRAIERGTKGIETILRYSTFNIIPTFLEILLVCCILWLMYGVWFSFITFSTMVVYALYTIIISQWRISFVKAMNETENQSSTKAVDSLLNFETVKYFCNEQYEASRFDQSLAQYENAAVKSWATLSVLNIGQAIIIAAGLFGVLFLAAVGVKNHTMTVGDFVLVNTYIIQLSMPLYMLGFAYREIKSAIISMQDMFNLLNIPPEITEIPDAKKLEVSKAKVVFDHVSFAYDPTRPILHDINFVIETGQTLAIVGESGAGKSTVSRLLFRFYDVSGGRILIDGQDIRDVTQDSVRQAIGIVPQDTVLFNDTIYYNILYGNTSASYDDVINASISAHIHEFIMSLPEGYNSMVGERGLKLSGGEKQRVAIARTILKNPEIYIFDEATSSLDTNTEKSIQASLKALSANHTTLIIAHRLSTIVDADEIIVIDKGYVAERGSHQTLLSINGLYAKLWRKQQKDIT